VSDNWLRLIPTAPTWVPDRSGEARGKVALQKMAPNAIEVSAESYDEINFVDCGGNFQGIFCSSCGAEVPVFWWHEAMDRAHEFRFIELQVTMACCAAVASLNDLQYDWPMGFAQWQLVAVGPERLELTDVEIRELEDAVGHSLRQI
jgi:hypothetical protein